VLEIEAGRAALVELPGVAGLVDDDAVPEAAAAEAAARRDDAIV